MFEWLHSWVNLSATVKSHPWICILRMQTERTYAAICISWSNCKNQSESKTQKFDCGHRGMTASKMFIVNCSHVKGTMISQHPHQIAPLRILWMMQQRSFAAQTSIQKCLPLSEISAVTLTCNASPIWYMQVSKNINLAYWPHHYWCSLLSPLPKPFVLGNNSTLVLEYREGELSLFAIFYKLPGKWEFGGGGCIWLQALDSSHWGLQEERKLPALFGHCLLQNSKLASSPAEF